MMRSKVTTRVVLLAVPVLAITAIAMAWSQGVASEPSQNGLTQVHEDFSRDPGWEGVNNRIECSDCPTITQNFGWSPTSYCGAGKGEIGGTIWRSRTPAYYAMPIGRPLTFNDAFSAAGRIVFRRIGEGAVGETGAAYIGFFNSAQQGWRPWSSVALRMFGKTDDTAGVQVDYMTSLWGGYGDELTTRLEGLNVPHTWRMSYDPNEVMGNWPDPRLQKYMLAERQTAEQIYAQIKKAEPGVTLDDVKHMLQQALDAGFVRFFQRPNGAWWTLNLDYGKFRGAITVQFDDGPKQRFFLLPEHRTSPIALDRFGIFNFQVYSSPIELYISDLKVNGEKVDLSQDPHWEGKGNRVSFVERDFQREDFGYSPTNWAGDKPGEIGGLFYRTEAVDPLHGYYADDIGRVTLDDPIDFSGSVAFTDGGTDSGMFLGYFNAKKKMATFKEKLAAQYLDDSMGILVTGPTRVGYYFSAQCSPKRELAKVVTGPVFLPNRTRHKFHFQYDPKANGGVGRITVTLDESSFHMDLTPQQRAAGANFDHFGLTNVRRGGKYLSIYFDDLTYTARRPAGYQPVRHKQNIVLVPFPKGGREY